MYDETSNAAIRDAALLLEKEAESHLPMDLEVYLRRLWHVVNNANPRPKRIDIKQVHQWMSNAFAHDEDLPLDDVGGRGWHSTHVTEPNPSVDGFQAWEREIFSQIASLQRGEHREENGSWENERVPAYIECGFACLIDTSRGRDYELDSTWADFTLVLVGGRSYE